MKRRNLSKAKRREQVWDILITGEQTASSVARALDLDYSYVGRILREMAREGIINVRTEPHRQLLDKRVYWIDAKKAAPRKRTITINGRKLSW